MEAVVLDLFGTLVAAPSPDERARAATSLAGVIGCDSVTVDRYFHHSWLIRHDGTLPTLSDLAAHLVCAVGGPHEVTESVADELCALGQARLMPDPSVVCALESLRSGGLRLGTLSDASPEVVSAWPTSPLATLMDAVVFSCAAGAVKPDRRLYRCIRDELDVPADRILYVGDGGGDELQGAIAAGMAAIAVRRRGSSDALAFGYTDWSGPVLDTVECLPGHLSALA